MFHAPVDISHVGECPTRRRVFHGDAPSRGRPRLSLSDHSSLSDPSSPSNRSNGNISSPSNLSNNLSFSSLSNQ